MQNHSLVTAHRDALARSVVAQRDELVRKAIDFKMGRTDWALEEVKHRGHIVEYSQPRIAHDFVFDDRALIRFYQVDATFEQDTHLKATQEYRVLRPKFEKYLKPTGEVT